MSTKNTSKGKVGSRRNDVEPLPPLSIEKARALAFAFIPRDVSALLAPAWINQSGLKVSEADRSLIVNLHLEDEVLREWRETAE
uniref:Uncharacterized protein n=1 Tax=Leviviridae sp. TaxID=2027243 RepID=A0A514D728_9VIRU|nr:MAG: hypothetical protein H3Bulk411627_000002 [Leviviridae sp.]